jgi:hypothetical protein
MHKDSCSKEIELLARERPFRSQDKHKNRREMQNEFRQLSIALRAEFTESQQALRSGLLTHKNKIITVVTRILKSRAKGPNS